MESDSGIKSGPGPVALTGVISHVCVDRQSADVVGVDHVGVPLLTVAGVMEDVVQRLCRHVFAHDPHLEQRQRRTGFTRTRTFRAELGPKGQRLWK